MKSIPHFVYQNGQSQPVLASGSPGTEGNRFGFEGGTVKKIDGAYHLFTTEMADNPKWVKTKLAYWTSLDGLSFTRKTTLFTSSGDYTGNDSRAALWSPMPFFDESELRWYLFYVTYRAAPNRDNSFYTNHAGRVVRARSLAKGIRGMGGPYLDVDTVLQPGDDSDEWEGLQGVDSFFLFPTDNGFHAFYGSCHTQNWPCNWWGVGLASSPTMKGPWKRLSDRNPVFLDQRFSENPIVTKLDDGWFVAVYDTGSPNSFGIASSSDGLNWNQGQKISLPPDDFPWLAAMRTPLCLLPEGNNLFTVYFTAYAREVLAEDASTGIPTGYGTVGRLTLRLLQQERS